MHISRRDFLEWAVAGALGAAASASGATRVAGAATRKPNILLILTDDLGWADLACYGNPFHETPNIDRLAAQGMRFTDAYAACPVCSPTRASIISGQYPARVGVTDFIPGHWRPYAPLRVPRNRTQYLPLELTSMAEALRNAGYATGHFGKWHLGGRDYFPDRQGFDEMIVTDGWGHFGNMSTPDQHYGEDDYLAEVLTDAAVEFMRDHRERPFFLNLCHFAVHIPLEARQELIAKYEEKPKPDSGVNNPVYAAMVEHVDRSVGRLLDELDALGLNEDTLVVFFSDNGGLYRRYDGEGEVVTTNAPLRDEKGSLYEGGIRVPLVARWPGRIRGGETCPVPVSSVDFYPSFLEVAGAPRPEQTLDGESLLPVMTGTGGVGRDAVYWHYPHYHHSTPAGAIRAGDWKLIEFFEDGRTELYNLANDPGETRNLAAEMGARALDMREMLHAWRQRVNAAMPVPNPDHDPARAAEWGRYEGPG